VHDGRLDTLLILLEFKGDRDCIAESQEWIVEGDGALVSDELEVAQAKPFGAPFALDGQVLTGAHGKEERAAGKLVGGSVEGAVIVG
jgi:hypothetical protein